MSSSHSRSTKSKRSSIRSSEAKQSKEPSCFADDEAADMGSSQLTVRSSPGESKKEPVSASAGGASTETTVDFLSDADDDAIASPVSSRVSADLDSSHEMLIHSKHLEGEKNDAKKKRPSSAKRSSTTRRPSSKSPSPRLLRKSEYSGCTSDAVGLPNSPAKSKKKKSKSSNDHSSSSRGRSKSPKSRKRRDASEEKVTVDKDVQDELLVLLSPMAIDKGLDMVPIKELQEKMAEIEQLRAELNTLKGKSAPNGLKSILKEEPSHQERMIFEKDATIVCQRDVIDRLKKDLIALESSSSAKRYKEKLAAVEVEKSMLMTTLADERRQTRIKLQRKDEAIAALRRWVGKLGGNPEGDPHLQNLRSDPPEDMNEKLAQSPDLSQP